MVATLDTDRISTCIDLAHTYIDRPESFKYDKEGAVSWCTQFSYTVESYVSVPAVRSSIA